MKKDSEDNLVLTPIRDINIERSDKINFNILSLLIIDNAITYIPVN